MTSTEFIGLCLVALLVYELYRRHERGRLRLALGKERLEKAALASKNEDLHAQLNRLREDHSKEVERQRANADRSIRLPENQYAAVIDEEVHWSKKRVLNAGEKKVFDVCREVANELAEFGATSLQIWPQVSLGQVLRASPKKAKREQSWMKNGDEKSRRAFGSINSKRCDFLIAKSDATPLAVIEFQGGDHYQGDANERDRVKQAALERAGIAYIEVEHGLEDQPKKLRLFLLDKLAELERTGRNALPKEELR